MFTDSLSYIQQLAALPYKYKYTNAIVNEVAEQLAKLTETNEVEIHFIPSHTEDVIEQSKEIDELAKHAAVLGDEEIAHDPFVSSYKLLLKKREKLKLIRYLKSHVKPSHFKGYPDRKLLVERKIKNADQTMSVLNSDNVLLNRAKNRTHKSKSTSEKYKN